MKPLDANLKVKFNTLRRNPYFDDLPEEMLKEIADKDILRQWTQPY